MENEKNKESNPNDLRRSLDQVLQYGKIEDLVKLLDEGMDVNQEDFSGRTALQLYAFRGNKEAVQMLLDQGADVNKINMYHDRIPLTALDSAREGKRKNVEEILLAHGAKTGAEINK